MKVSPREYASAAIVEELGFAPTARVLLVHADDLGLSGSVNDATFKALEASVITSASIMVPGLAFPEVVLYALRHGEADLGIHLTLTSEWNQYRWGPIASRQQVPSLLDCDGYLHRDCAGMLRHAIIEEVEIEIRAQIDYAFKAGLRPSHIDSHMSCLFRTAELYQILLSIASDYGLPCLTKPGWRPPGHSVVDGIIMAKETVPPSEWENFYTISLASLRPGIYQFVVHLGTDDSELQDITRGHEHWNASWRQRDLDFVFGNTFRSTLANNDIIVTNWAAIKGALSRLQSRG